MQPVDKLIMFSMAVRDMPNAKAFYADKLGLSVTTEFCQDDQHWWVTVALPQVGAAITLTTVPENMQPGTMKLYFSTSDVEAAHQELSENGANPIRNDLFGPGSGVKWFSLQDPDGNQILVAQA